MRIHNTAAAAALALLLGPVVPASAEPGSPPPPRFATAKLLPSSGGNVDVFGSALAISGRTAVAGAPGDSDVHFLGGTARVYYGPAAGWSGHLFENARLIPSDSAAFDQFGTSVAIDGGIVVVGAYNDDDTGSESGAAYVFVEPPGGWSGLDVHESAKLLASDGAAGDHFGVSVAVSGSTIVVGAYEADANGVDSGAGYVFTEPAGGWSGILTEDAKLLPSEVVAGDEYGGRVAVSGSTAVVGAWYHDNNGTAYVFDQPAGGWSGAPAESAKLVPSVVGTLDDFAISVGISGPDVVIGADNTDGHGVAYVYREPSGGWAGTLTEDAKLHASDGAPGDAFGRSVAISGSRIVVGAYAHDEGASDTGAAYLFNRPGGGWAGTLTEDAELLAGDGDADDHLGVAVALAADVVVAGAPNDFDAGSASGSAEVFDFVVFTDGFESGDTAAWSFETP